MGERCTDCDWHPSGRRRSFCTDECRRAVNRALAAAWQRTVGRERARIKALANPRSAPQVNPDCPDCEWHRTGRRRKFCEGDCRRLTRNADRRVYNALRVKRYAEDPEFRLRRLEARRAQGATTEARTRERARRAQPEVRDRINAQRRARRDLRDYGEFAPAFAMLRALRSELKNRGDTPDVERNEDANSRDPAIDASGGACGAANG